MKCSLLRPGGKNSSIKRVIAAVARNVQIPESVKIQEEKLAIVSRHQGKISAS